MQFIKYVLLDLYIEFLNALCILVLTMRVQAADDWKPNPRIRKRICTGPSRDLVVVGVADASIPSITRRVIHTTCCPLHVAGVTHGRDAGCFLNSEYHPVVAAVAEVVLTDEAGVWEAV
jgi:hypothetical protein